MKKLCLALALALGFAAESQATGIVGVQAFIGPASDSIIIQQGPPVQTFLSPAPVQQLQTFVQPAPFVQSYYSAPLVTQSFVQRYSAPVRIQTFVKPAPFVSTFRVQREVFVDRRAIIVQPQRQVIRQRTVNR